ALKNGSPRHVAMALMWGALFQKGRERPPRVDELLDRAEAPVMRFEDSNLRAFVMRTRVQAYFLWGELVRCRELCDEAAEFISARCTAIGRTERVVAMFASSV